MLKISASTNKKEKQETFHAFSSSWWFSKSKSKNTSKNKKKRKEMKSNLK